MATTTTEEKKPKTIPMKWLKLGEAKDPEFGKDYFLYADVGNKELSTPDFQVGNLAGIKQVPSGKQFSWNVEGQEDERTYFTHYAICKPPVE